MLRASVIAAGAVLALAGWTGSALAQDAVNQFRDKVNQHVVGIMAGRPGSTDLDLAYDLDVALSDGYNLRVVPMVSQGSAKEFEDLLYLRGVDMAVVQHDVIQFMDQNAIYPGIKDAVRLITPVGTDQFHILASTDIQSIYDLAGKKVNFGRTGSGTSMTASVVFDALGIEVDVTLHEHKAALEMLRSGEIAAMTRATGAPSSLFEEIDTGENLHFIEVPATPSVTQSYAPVAITSEHYPKLIAPGASVSSVGVATVLISYNWPKGHPRGETLASFTEAFFTQFDKLLEPGHHETWSTIDISDEIPGLPRHWSAEESLQRVKGRSS
ncbi:MAG: TAXI family TRAP transporter solute-binding subunit [Pseudomonadota bacterium]